LSAGSGAVTRSGVWAYGKINDCLDTGELVANGTAQPGHPVLPSRVVADADGSNT
jgi:hypothetical protein